MNTYKQNFKNFDRNKLKENFHKNDWDKVILENDNNINEALNSFYKTFTEILDHHATEKERILHLKPWIKEEFSISYGKEISCFESIAPVRSYELMNLKGWKILLLMKLKYLKKITSKIILKN